MSIKSAMLHVNRALRSQKRRLVLLVLLVSIAGAVVGAHSGLTDAHGEDHLAETAAVCLAVFTGAGLLVAAGGLGKPHRPRPVGGLAPPELTSSPPVPRARAGPIVLQVFRL